MDWIQILELISAIIVLVVSVTMLVRFLIKSIKFSKKKNVVKKIFANEDFEFVENIENEKQTAKANLKQKVAKYFNNLFIGEFKINLFFNFITTEIGKGKKATKIAWDFLITILTSVLANESKGLISEAVTSIFNIFKKSKEFLFETDNPSLITDIILKIMNLKIRPILTATRSFPSTDKNGILVVDDSKLSIKQIDDFWAQVNALRIDLIENKYLRFISLAALSTQTNDDIIKLLNYKPINKETKENIELDEEIADDIEKITELEEKS